MSILSSRLSSLNQSLLGSVGLLLLFFSAIWWLVDWVRPPRRLMSIGYDDGVLDKHGARAIVREVRPGKSAALLCYMWLQLVELPHTKSLTKFATTTATTTSRTATCYRPVSLFIECSLDFLACGLLFCNFVFGKLQHTAHTAHTTNRDENKPALGSIANRAAVEHETSLSIACMTNWRGA